MGTSARRAGRVNFCAEQRTYKKRHFSVECSETIANFWQPVVGRESTAGVRQFTASCNPGASIGKYKQQNSRSCPLRNALLNKTHRKPPMRFWGDLVHAGGGLSRGLWGFCHSGLPRVGFSISTGKWQVFMVWRDNAQKRGTGGKQGKLWDKSGTKGNIEEEIIITMIN